MLLKDLSVELQNTYVKNNNITGAFYWKENNNKYSVFIGDNDNLSGWVEYKELSRKEAIIKTKELQNIIDKIISG